MCPIFYEININLCSMCKSVKRHVENYTFLTRERKLEDDFMFLNEKIGMPDAPSA